MLAWLGHVTVVWLLLFDLQADEKETCLAINGTCLGAQMVAPSFGARLVEPLLLMHCVFLCAFTILCMCQ